VSNAKTALAHIQQRMAEERSRPSVSLLALLQTPRKTHPASDEADTTRSAMPSPPPALSSFRQRPHVEL
jgi:hypothetical protein